MAQKRLPQFAALNRKTRRVAASGIAKPTAAMTSLDEEVAAPTLGGVRTVFSSHPAQGLTPERLTRILRSAEQQDADLFFDLAEDMEERDPHYAGVLRTRKLAVSQLPITIEAVDESAEEEAKADMLRSFFERDSVEDELFDILDALGKGISYTEVVWDRSQTPWLPSKLVTRDPKWFVFDQVDGATPLLKADDGTRQHLEPFKFVVHTPKIKTGIPIRGGLARLIAWSYLFKNYALKDWMIFAEVFGMPIRVGKYGPSATEGDRRALMRAVQGIGTDAAAIIPASMMIEFIEGGEGNYEVYEKFCTYLDLQISKGVLGQTSTTDAVAGGLGGSQANVHNDVRADIQRADAKQLAATLMQLVRWIIDFNYGPPASGNYPKLKIGQADAFTTADMAMVESAVDMDVDIPEAWLLDKMGIPTGPDTDADGKPVKMLRRSPATTPSNAEAGVRPITASKTPASALLNLLRPLKSALEVSASVPAIATGPKRDAVDILVDELADHWAEVTDPMIALIEQVVGAAATPDDLRAGLLKLANMDQSAMTELLARSAFAARLAGETGLGLRNGQ